MVNKYKGSVIVKIAMWGICVGSAVAAVFFGILLLIGYDEYFFNYTYKDALEGAFINVNEEYSIEAFHNMMYSRNDYTIDEEGFQYGILKGDSQLEKVDFNAMQSYVKTNLTEEELSHLDKNELFMCYIMENANSSTLWDSYGYIGKYEDLSTLSALAEEFTQRESGQWVSQYADAVCYDVASGIFYYRSEGEYYPAHAVAIPFYTGGAWYNYLYDYDYDKKAYVFREQYPVVAEGTAIETDMPSENNQADAGIPMESADSSTDGNADANTENDLAGSDRKDINLEAILTGEGTGGVVDFTQLEGTAYSYKNWKNIELDNVRHINGSELTQINSREIDKENFVGQVEYYLDENYTLHKKNNIESNGYWVASIVPKTAPETEIENRYASASWIIDLFYSYGQDAGNILIIMMILAVVSFVFLAFAAGHRKNRKELVLSWFDCLPLEVFTVMICILEAGVFVPFLLGVRLWNFKIYPDMSLKFLSAIGCCAVALALWYVLSLCVRIKCGKWWRNSILYWIYGIVCRLVGKIMRHLNILWKFMLIMGGVALLEFLVIYTTTNRKGWFFPWFFIKAAVCFFILVLIIQMYELQMACKQMAMGDLAYKVDTRKMFWECRKHGENLNRISEGMSKAVDERMKSERMKTELITNVSHDIKTPLTSIINYVDLLGREELHNEKAAEYLEVLDRQSSKLKKLIEDLVEASKASTGNLSYTNELIDAGVFLTQTVGEFEEKLQQAELELIVTKTEEPVYILADGRHLWRIVDNLMNNICKYAQPHTRVYVNLDATNQEAAITFRNMSNYPLNINSDELMERFVRGDKSRNTEGHGLGLSIAKSLMDLMGGEMNIVIDGDLFKVVLQFARQSA